MSPPAAIGRLVRVMLAVALTLPLLASCYIPDDFLAEIRLARNGDYAFIYKGTLVWAPLIIAIAEGKLTAEEIKEKHEAVIRDLKRDSHFQVLEPVGPGRFKVFYERLGRFTGPRKVTFVRGGAEIITMEMLSNGTIRVMGGREPKMDDIQTLRRLNLEPSGKLRVMTNAVRVETNGTRSAEGLPGYPDWQVFDWTIRTAAGAPPILKATLN